MSQKSWLISGLGASTGYQSLIIVIFEFFVIFALFLGTFNTSQCFSSIYSRLYRFCCWILFFLVNSWATFAASTPKLIFFIKLLKTHNMYTAGNCVNIYRYDYKQMIYLVTTWIFRVPMPKAPFSFLTPRPTRPPPHLSVFLSWSPSLSSPAGACLLAAP